MDAPPTRYPLARMMLGNATLLSVIYLAFGLALELARRITNWRWTEWMCAALDALPEGALKKAGVWTLMNQAYHRGWISEVHIRLLFGLTTLFVIFATAFLVGVCMWGVRAWVERAAPKAS